MLMRQINGKKLIYYRKLLFQKSKLIVVICKLIIGIAII